MKKHLILLPLILMLLNCSVQKRKFQKGYYVEWKHPRGTEKVIPLSPDKKPAESLPAKAKTLFVRGHEESLATADQKPSAAGIIKRLPVLFSLSPDSLCDELIFKDGSEVKVKVTEIGSSELKYKKCDMPDGPMYTVRKSDVFMVKYSNGTRETFKSEDPAVAHQKSAASRRKMPLKDHPLAVWSLSLGIVGLMFFLYFLVVPSAILAIVLGRKAERRIKENPDLYKGLGLAKAGTILGIVSLSIVLFALLVAILFFLTFI